MGDRKIKPYKEELIDNWFYRTFDEATAKSEMVWHRDREDRIIEPVEPTDWLFQIENQLPVPIEGQLFVPMGCWHRAIKGTGNLKIRIKKL
jgi:hypothetical protein